MPFEPREAQTRVKHSILRRYIGAFAGIIGSKVRGIVFGPGGVSSLTLDLIYLDGFAGYGRYDGDADDPDTDEPVWGSPIIGIQALEEAAEDLQSPPRFQIRVSGVAVESEPERYDELLENLEKAPIHTPVRKASRFEPSAIGCVTVIRDDFREHMRPILESLSEDQFLFAFIDPYGTSMPFTSLQHVIARRHTDVMTLFPSYEVELRSHSATKHPSRRRPQEEENIRRIDRLYGIDSWRSIVAEKSWPLEKRVAAYAELYQERLAAIEQGMVVKSIGLRFSEIDRPIYHLFLTTRNAHGAMRMNDILRDAEYEKHWMQWRDREAKAERIQEEQGVLEFDWDVPHVAPPDPDVPEPSRSEVKEVVLEVLESGQTYRYETVLGMLASTPYLRTEINRALRSLDDDGVLECEGTRSSDDLIFVKQQP